MSIPLRKVILRHHTRYLREVDRVMKIAKVAEVVDDDEPRREAAIQEEFQMQAGAYDATTHPGLKIASDKQHSVGNTNVTEHTNGWHLSKEHKHEHEDGESPNTSLDSSPIGTNLSSPATTPPTSPIPFSKDNDGDKTPKNKDTTTTKDDTPPKWKITQSELAKLHSYHKALTSMTRSLNKSISRIYDAEKAGMDHRHSDAHRTHGGRRPVSLRYKRFADPRTAWRHGYSALGVWCENWDDVEVDVWNIIPGEARWAPREFAVGDGSWETDQEDSEDQDEDQEDEGSTAAEADFDWSWEEDPEENEKGEGWQIPTVVKDDDGRRNSKL